MAVRYRVTKPCFYQGCFREPGNKHEIVVLPEKLAAKDTPSYLEFVPEPKPEPTRGRKKEDVVEPEPVEYEAVSIADTDVI
jgi:hypothetical protein